VAEIGLPPSEPASFPLIGGRDRRVHPLPRPWLMKDWHQPPLGLRIPMCCQRRGSRKRIVAPDGSAIAPAIKPQPDGTGAGYRGGYAGGASGRRADAGEAGAAAAGELETAASLSGCLRADASRGTGLLSRTLMAALGGLDLIFWQTFMLRINAGDGREYRGGAQISWAGARRAGVPRTRYPRRCFA
jgi:hypothetical protein